MNIQLDAEARRLVQVYLDYVHKGPDILPGVIADAIATGLLSLDTMAAVQAELAAIGEVDGEVVDTRIVPAAVARAGTFASALGVPVDGMPRLLLAAARAGLRMLTRTLPGGEVAP